MARYEDLPYRTCVGVMLINPKGLVFIGRRAGGVEHAAGAVLELDHFTGLDVVQTIDAGDTVADGQHLSDFGDFSFLAEILDLVLEDRGNFRGADVHQPASFIACLIELSLVRSEPSTMSKAAAPPIELASADPTIALEMTRWLAHLGAERRLSPKTLEAYGRDLRQCLDFLCSHWGERVTLERFASLEATDIRAFMLSSALICK